MAFIEYGGKRHVVPAGEMLVGTGADCHLRLAGPGIALRHAVLTTAPDQSVSIRKLPDGGEVEINGVMLGNLPQPLLHGDKITLAGVDLLFVDERKSGSTQYVSAVKLQDLAAGAVKKAGGPGKATAATGGRIVSLTDGREYQVIGGSLKFGRDASADVVVAGSQVSRRHAEIVVSPRGYILVDSSTNGTFVNGERVQNQRLLARADVIRLGEEEFRFYADAQAQTPMVPGAPSASAQSPQSPQSPQGVPMAQAASPVSPAPPVSPSSPASPSSPPRYAPPVGPTTPSAPMQPQRAAASAAPAPPAAPAPSAPAPSSAAPPRPATPPATPPAAAQPPRPVPPAAPQPPRPAAPQPPKPGLSSSQPGAAQLISTGYFPSGAKSTPAPSPRTAEDLAIPGGPAAPPTGRAGSATPPAPPKPAAAQQSPQSPQSPQGAPVVPKAPQALAKFLVRSGSLKGQRLYVKVPVVNIGRAEYNDLVIPDDSVSSQHAKLTRREGVWMLSDVGSTNGTLVDGERINGDTPIAPGAFVRFGDIQLVFEPTDDDAGMNKSQGTRAISAIKINEPKPPQGR